MSWKSFFTKDKKEDLDQGLEKTKTSFFLQNSEYSSW